VTRPASRAGPGATLIASVGLRVAVISRPLTRRSLPELDSDVVAAVCGVHRTGGGDARDQFDRPLRARLRGVVSDRDAILPSARCIRVPRGGCRLPRGSARAPTFVDRARASGRRLLGQGGRGCMSGRPPWDADILDQGGVDHEPDGHRDCGEDRRRDEVGEAMHAQSAVEGVSFDDGPRRRSTPSDVGTSTSGSDAAAGRRYPAATRARRIAPPWPPPGTRART
jgi:hypothetical protein